MLKILLTYLSTVVVLVLVDLVWLGYIAKPMYQAGIGHLMADKPNLIAALCFYVLFPIGLVVFAILPEVGTTALSRTALLAALFGFLAYATYDLSNLATLKNYPVQLALVDMLWGSLLSATAATAGKLVFHRL